MPSDSINHRMHIGTYDLSSQSRAGTTIPSGKIKSLNIPRRVTPPPESYTFWNNLCHSVRFQNLSINSHQNKAHLKSKHCLLTKLLTIIFLPILTLTLHNNSGHFDHYTRQGQGPSHQPVRILGGRPIPGRHLDTCLGSWPEPDALTADHTTRDHRTVLTKMSTQNPAH